MTDDRQTPDERTIKAGTYKCPDCGQDYTASGTDIFHKDCAYGGTLIQLPNDDSPGPAGPITPRQITPPSSKGTSWTPPSRGMQPSRPRTPSATPQRPSGNPTGDSPKVAGSGGGTGHRNPPVEVMEAMKDPTRLMGKYVLVQFLGKGGMGEVWKAWERKIGRFVAVKFLTAQSDDDGLRFQREAEVAASVQHPHIASIYEFDEYQGQLYIAMQYIDGRSLANVKLTADETLAIMQKVCEAVHFAHQKGIIHRDLKPANIMVNSDNWPFVMDFGLAKQVDAGTTLSAYGQILGTPAFMAPEQAQPETSTIDHRADIYGLGSTMYSMLTGKAPFPGKSAAEIVMKVVHEEPQPPSIHDAAIPKDVEKVALHALEKKPENRYQTAADMASDIVSVRRGDTGIRYKPVADRRRSKNALVVALSALGILGVLGGGGYWWSTRPAPKKEEEDTRKREVEPPGTEVWRQELRKLRQPLQRDSFKSGDAGNKERAAKLNAHLRNAGDVSRNVLKEESRWFTDQAEPGLELIKVWLGSDSNIRVEHKPDAQRMIEWASSMQELLKNTDEPIFAQTAPQLDPLIAAAQRLLAYAGKAILRINIHPSARIQSLKAGDQWVIKDGKVTDATRLSLPDAGDLETPTVFQDLEIDDYVIELANDELKKRATVTLDKKRMEHGKEYFLTGSIAEDNSIKLRP